MDSRVVGPVAWNVLNRACYLFDRSVIDAVHLRALIYSMAFVFPCAKCRLNFGTSLTALSLSNYLKRGEAMAYIYDLHSLVNRKKQAQCTDAFIQTKPYDFTKLYASIGPGHEPRKKDFVKSNVYLSSTVFWDFIAYVTIGLSLNSGRLIPEYRIFYASISSIFLDEYLNTEELLLSFNLLDHKSTKACTEWVLDIYQATMSNLQENFDSVVSDTTTSSQAMSAIEMQYSSYSQFWMLSTTPELVKRGVRRKWLTAIV